MDISQLAVRLIILLLPGVISALLVEVLTVHKKWSQFRFGLYSVVLGLIAYAVLQTLAAAFNGALHEFNITCFNPVNLTFWDSLFDDTKPVKSGEVLIAVVLSIPIGYFASFTITKKWINRLGYKLKVTEKYGDESLYYYSLNSPDVSWVRVRLDNKGLIYEGWRQSFSEDEHGRELVLRDVKVYRLVDSAFLYNLPVAYLSASYQDLVIEFPVIQ